MRRSRRATGSRSWWIRLERASKLTKTPWSGVLLLSRTPGDFAPSAPMDLGASCHPQVPTRRASSFQLRRNRTTTMIFLNRCFDFDRYASGCADRRVDVEFDIPRLEAYHQRVARLAIADRGRRPIAPPAVDRFNAQHVPAKQFNRWPAPHIAMQRTRRHTILSQYPPTIGRGSSTTTSGGVHVRTRSLFF
jgi:hypothetical protein